MGRGETCRMNARSSSRPVRLIHLTTVPQTLYFLVSHFRALSQRGVQVEVVAAPGEELDRLCREENLNSHAVPMTRQITPWNDLLALVRLIKIFRDIRPDIVHAHTPKGGLLGMLAAWLAGVPVRIYHVHGLPMETATGIRRMLLAWSDWVACRCAQQVYGVSHSVRDVIVREGLCPESRIKVLNHGSISGIDASKKFVPDLSSMMKRSNVRARWGIGLDDLVIGFVGRLVRDKGFCELAASWHILKKEFAQLHLLIVGDFETEEPELEIAKRELQHDPRVHFAGIDRNVVPLFAAMDVVEFPTYREGLGLVPLEAGAMQIPVVATRVTGCVDAVVNGVTGSLVAPRDAVMLADALRIYLLDPELRRQHGLAARRHVLANFDPEEVLTALFTEYDRLLSPRGRSLVSPRTPSSKAA